MRFVAARAMALALILSLTSCKPEPHGALRTLHIDASSSTGRFRSLQGVNGAPGANFHKPVDFLFGGWNMPQNIDVTEGYRRARIDLVRTHDAYGPGDIDPHFGAPHCLKPSVVSPERDSLAIFPNPDANPDDPASYHFGPTDQLIASIKNIDAEVMFRIGRSECSAVDPPKDFDQYASIVEHIVLHYNQGWANGFHYQIRYWEVWNEPDLGKLFWGGTPEQFYALYGKIARAVKKADPEALVGGPAISRPNDDSPYREPFLEFVREQKLPLDFYSWHWYASDSNDPLDVTRIAHNIRLRLDSMGFHKTQSVVNEWNYGLGDPLPPDVQRASFLTAALAYMQDAPVDLSALYRADNVFGSNGETPNKVGQALIALGRMKDTPVRLKTTGADQEGFAVQAGRSLDGQTIQVLVTNYEIPQALRGPRSRPNVLSVPNVFEVRLLERRSVSYRDNAGYDLAIDHLPAAKRYSIERYRISSNEDFQRVDRTEQTGPLIRLSAPLLPPGIELIVIHSTTKTETLSASAY